MSLQSKEQLFSAFIQLGQYLKTDSQALESIKYKARNNNAWFTLGEINRATSATAEMLKENDLIKWFENIELAKTPKNIGLILAGNIPMVGFHDIICVLASGHKVQIKLSSSDNQLIPFVLKKLIEFIPQLENQIQFTPQLKGFDAVIATGNNNSSRYFDYYFGKVPHIIRKNRNSLAILDGTESEAQIIQLGHDIFDYYGMGCRSVSKIYIPEGYDFKNLFEPLEAFKDITNHHKYHNNYDYNKSIYLINQVEHLDNGFLLLKPDEGLASPLAVVYSEIYKNLDDLSSLLKNIESEIQCVVSQHKFLTIPTYDLGQSQYPKLWDYADNINTINFLTNLN